MLVVIAGLDKDDDTIDEETADPNDDRFDVVDGGTLLTVVAVLLTSGSNDEEDVDPEDATLVALSAGSVPGIDTEFEVACGVDIALAVSVRA